MLLLAAAHPSKEIAQRLGLSVRTIENIVNHAYAKLGLSGRADLRALLESRRQFSTTPRPTSSSS